MDKTQKDPTTAPADLKQATQDEAQGRRALALADASSEIIELKTKIAALVRDSFGGDYKKAFGYYDPDQDGIGSDELSQLLEEADVGNVFTRSSWVAGILDKVDTDQDGRISWAEFEQILKTA